MNSDIVTFCDTLGTYYQLTIGFWGIVDDSSKSYVVLRLKLLIDSSVHVLLYG
jgi:hypothetical protein